MYHHNFGKYQPIYQILTLEDCTRFVFSLLDWMKMTDHENCRTWNWQTNVWGMKMQYMKMTDQKWCRVCNWMTINVVFVDAAQQTVNESFKIALTTNDCHMISSSSRPFYVCAPAAGLLWSNQISFNYVWQTHTYTWIKQEKMSNTVTNDNTVTKLYKKAQLTLSNPRDVKACKIAPIRRVSFHFAEFHFPEFQSLGIGLYSYT